MGVTVQPSEGHGKRQQQGRDPALFPGIVKGEGIGFENLGCGSQPGNGSVRLVFHALGRPEHTHTHAHARACARARARSRGAAMEGGRGLE